MCPKLEQLPYIRRKVANVSGPILLRQKLTTRKTNIPCCPDVPGSTQGSLYSPSFVAASNTMNFCHAVHLRWKSDLKTPFELFLASLV